LSAAGYSRASPFGCFVAEDPAGKRAGARSDQGAPTGVPAGNGGDAGSRDSAKGSAAERSLLGAVHVGTAEPSGYKRQYEYADGTFRFHGMYLLLREIGDDQFIPDDGENRSLVLIRMGLEPRINADNDFLARHMFKSRYPALFKRRESM
jgi:hypothetical protein